MGSCGILWMFYLCTGADLPNCPSEILIYKQWGNLKSVFSIKIEASSRNCDSLDFVVREHNICNGSRG